MKPGPRIEPFLDTLRQRTISVDDLTLDMARALSGEANASRGIRAAVRFAYDMYQADRFTPGKTTAAPTVPGLKWAAPEPPAGDPAPLAEPP